MLHIHTYVHTYIHILIQKVCMHIRMYVRTYVFTHNQCSCVHLHLIYVQCTYVDMYKYIHMYVHMYIRTHASTQTQIHLYTHAIHISTTVITFDIRTYQDKCANLPEDGSHRHKNSSTIRWCWYMCGRNSLCWDQCLPLSTRQCLVNERCTVE